MLMFNMLKMLFLRLVSLFLIVFGFNLDLNMSVSLTVANNNFFTGTGNKFLDMLNPPWAIKSGLYPTNKKSVLFWNSDQNFVIIIKCFSAKKLGPIVFGFFSRKIGGFINS